MLNGIHEDQYAQALSYQEIIMQSSNSGEQDFLPISSYQAELFADGGLDQYSAIQLISSTIDQLGLGYERTQGGALIAPEYLILSETFNPSSSSIPVLVKSALSLSTLEPVQPLQESSTVSTQFYQTAITSPNVQSLNVSEAASLNAFYDAQNAADDLYDQFRRIEVTTEEVPVTEEPVDEWNFIDGTPQRDLLIGTDTRDWIRGFESGDVIRAGDHDDRIQGFEGNDHLSGEAGDDEIFAGTGNDRAYGGFGQDVLYGEQGNDRLFGEQGDDRLEGGLGNDRLFGGDGNDALFGQEGNDFIRGNDGDDQIYGGVGGDNLRGDHGQDQLFGEEGEDSLLGGRGDDVLFGGNDDDGLSGNQGNDTLWGEQGHDVLSGGSGDDLLYGGQGNDYILGGSGNDHIRGGQGNDIMSGGSGNDTFHVGQSDGMDTIQGGGWTDIIELDATIVSVTQNTPNDWILETDLGESILLQSNKDFDIFTKAFQSSATGSLQFEDGSRVDFSSIESLDWSNP